MSEFTKGTWEAFHGKNVHAIRQSHSDDEYGYGKLIAYIAKWNEGQDWANARLIASAPEMYELLTLAFQNDIDEDYWKRVEDVLDYIDGTNTNNAQ